MSKNKNENNVAQEPIETTVVEPEETEDVQDNAGQPAPEPEVADEPKVKWYDRSVKDNAQRFWRKVKTPLAIAGGVLAGAGLVVAKMNLTAQDEFEYDNGDGYTPELPGTTEDDGTDNTEF